ncbi:hypothetical protein FSW04_20175 [Baekduia soli]|uniref:CD-NTase-associated protein 12/Pycsar effector protein TIR domain-containing protein n=1 Tax=Baekduia soli TaxID=496014 RepID=A0A5B8U9H4_9ACTN|nr:nucleotide-binding protein [Baekduia soli]QEC49665.1 hypothetical protein FSW04_20175 [Baekduia soli]
MDRRLKWAQTVMLAEDFATKDRVVAQHILDSLNQWHAKLDFGHEPVPDEWDDFPERQRTDWAHERFKLLNDKARAELRAVLGEPTAFRAPSVSDPPPTAATDVANTIFVVHGHAHAILHEAVRVLERGTGREVVVLHEQPNRGQTILEKFESHAAGAAYAVVLLTGDDVGGVADGEQMQRRGRQNVVFEFGFFCAQLGRKKVAVLMSEGVEKPSDIDGLVYIGLDPAGAWKLALGRELEAADIPFDHRKIP